MRLVPPLPALFVSGFQDAAPRAAMVENGFPLATGGATETRTKRNSTLALPGASRTPPADLPAP